MCAYFYLKFFDKVLQYISLLNQKTKTVTQQFPLSSSQLILFLYHFKIDPVKFQLQKNFIRYTITTVTTFSYFFTIEVSLRFQFYHFEKIKNSYATVSAITQEHLFIKLKNSVFNSAAKQGSTATKYNTKSGFQYSF